MRIIHGQEFDQSTLDEYKIIIRNNVMRGMQILIDAKKKFGIPWADEDNAVFAEHVFTSDNHAQYMTQEEFAQISSSIYVLWRDKGIQTTFDRRSELYLVSVLPQPNAEC